MAEERIQRRRAAILAADMVGGAIVALGLALALASCAAPSARTPEDIAKAGALVKTAVGDAEEAARRARAFNSANIWTRAANELEEAEVILRKARDERERIRKAHGVAVAALAALRAKAPTDDLGDASGKYDPYTPPGHDSDVTAAADHVDRIGAILAAADRHVATIEQTFATLQDQDIPSRH